MTMESRRPGESLYDASVRLAEGFVGVNEEQEVISLIQMLAARHGLDLSNDRFASYCRVCQQQGPCDAAMLTVLVSKLHWLIGASARQR